LTVLNGKTFATIGTNALSDCHNGHCFGIAVDNQNRFLATGGSDSLIGLWDMASFMLIKTLSNNDARVMALSLSHEGNFIASISEDDINKKYSIEVYDFDYDNPMMSGSTLYTYTSIYEKQCLSWNPKRNILAFAGEDKEGGNVQILVPQENTTSSGSS